MDALKLMNESERLSPAEIFDLQIDYDMAVLDPEAAAEGIAYSRKGGACAEGADA